MVTFSPAYPLSAKTRWMNGKMYREARQKRFATITVLKYRRMRFEHEAAPVRVHGRMARASAVDDCRLGLALRRPVRDPPSRVRGFLDSVKTLDDDLGARHRGRSLYARLTVTINWQHFLV